MTKKRKKSCVDNTAKPHKTGKNDEKRKKNTRRNESLAIGMTCRNNINTLIIL